MHLRAVLDDLLNFFLKTLVKSNQHKGNQLINLVYAIKTLVE